MKRVEEKVDTSSSKQLRSVVGEGLVDKSEVSLAKGLGNIEGEVVSDKLDVKLTHNNQPIFSPTCEPNQRVFSSSIGTTSETQTSVDLTYKKNDDATVPVDFLLQWLNQNLKSDIFTAERHTHISAIQEQFLLLI